MSGGQAESWEIGAENVVGGSGLQFSTRDLPTEQSATRITHTMNKPRKDLPPAMSRTLAIATGIGRSNQERISRDVQPRTNVEQYWAARALKAETALSTKDTHQLEVQHLRDSEETKRIVRAHHRYHLP